MSSGFDSLDRAAAYLTGEFSAEEAAEFEREMAEDPGLREEVEACRRALEQVNLWMRAEAPGESALVALPPLPILRKGENADTSYRAPRVWWGRPRFAPSPFLGERRGEGRGGLRWALQGLAACVIFALGFALGSSTSTPPRLEEAPLQLTAQASAAMPVPGRAVETTKQTTPKPRGAEPSRTQVVDEGGRLVIETNLAGSTARAVWVVDGNFRLE